MSSERRLTVQTIADQLRPAMRYGARATQLAEHAAGLVDLLTRGHPGTDDDRALHAEQIIRDAVAALDGPAGPAMRIMLGLEPGTWHTRIETRRERAADQMGITPGAFRRPRREGTYLRDVAFEIWRRTRTSAP
jgi:hypothetical protein